MRNTPAAERNLTVDVAKGIGIVLVVLGHNVVFREQAHSAYEAIYLFHMPLFFLLSGVTFRYTEPAAAFRKRFRSLLVPYFAMGVMAIAFDSVVAEPAAVIADFRGVLYGTGNALRFTPLWFLPCLFLVSMSASLLLAVRARMTREALQGRNAAGGGATAVASCSSVASGSAVDVSAASGSTNSRAPSGLDVANGSSRFLAGVAILGITTGAAILVWHGFAVAPFEDETGRPLGLPWSLDLLPFVLGLFTLGILVARSRLLRECPQPWLVLFGGVALLTALIASGASLDLNYRRMTFPLAVVPGMMAGVAAAIALSSLISRSGWAARVFSYLGSASLVLLMFHSPVQRRVLEQLAPYIRNQVVLFIAGTSVTVAIICVVDLCVLRRVRAVGWVCYPQRRVTGTA